MVERSVAEGRVILTSDRMFIRLQYSDQAYLVRGANKQEQLTEVLSAFNIAVDSDALLTRCARCNGEFHRQ